MKTFLRGGLCAVVESHFMAGRPACVFHHGWGVVMLSKFSRMGYGLPKFWERGVMGLQTLFFKPSDGHGGGGRKSHPHSLYSVSCDQAEKWIGCVNSVLEHNGLRFVCGQKILPD